MAAAYPLSTRPRPMAPLAPIACALAVASVAAVGLAALGTRWGWWGMSAGFTILRYGFWGSATAVLLGMIAVVVTRPGASRRGLPLAILAVALGALGTGTLMSWVRRGSGAPPIHDITTDPGDPPPFVALLPLRAGAPDAASYGGPGVAALQAQAYPGVRPLLLPVPPLRAYQLALTGARAMGWRIVAAVPTEGRIEATASTFWLGFKDDVVVRIRPREDGSRIDVRSTSRVGRGDYGTNAHRIEVYLARLRALPSPS